MLDSRYRLGKAVKARIHQLEDFGRYHLVLGDLAAELATGSLGAIDHFGNAGDDPGQGWQIANFFDLEPELIFVWRHRP